MRRGVLMLALGVVLSACGQRGDLYFPSEERAAVVTVPAPQAPAQPATSEDDADETTRQDAATTPAPDNAGR